MKFRNPFKRQAKGGVIQVIRGIKECDWCDIYEALFKEYKETAQCHKKPTEYMRGLQFAIDVLEAHKPYNIAEVQ